LNVLTSRAARQQGEPASGPAVACPGRGVHHTSPTDGCIHRLTVGCQRDNVISIDHSCSAPGQNGIRLTSRLFVLSKITILIFNFNFKFLNVFLFFIVILILLFLFFKFIF